MSFENYITETKFKKNADITVTKTQNNIYRILIKIYNIQIH